MSDKLVLNAFESDYGLVSLDVACIQSILHAKLAGAPIEINPLNNLKSCALNSAPSLRHRKEVIKGAPNIINYLDKVYGNIDAALSPRQSSETLALTNLLQVKMKPVLDFLYWVEPRNVDEFTSKWYMRSLPFPFNYSYTKRKRLEGQLLMETLYPMDSDLEIIKEFVIKSATQSLSTISTRLGSLKYFYGDHPTSLDVVVYAHLAPLSKVPFPSNDISALLSMWPNLSDFIKHIDSKYFTEVDQRQVKYLKQESIMHQNEDDVSYMALFILVVSASTLALGFAMKRGMISFEFP